MEKEYRFIGEVRIKQVITEREEYLRHLDRKIENCIKEIERLESSGAEDSYIGAVALKGRSYEREQLTRTNAKTDTYDIIESYRKIMENELNDYKEMLKAATTEKCEVERIWQIYINLDFRLHEILKKKYLENATWEAIAFDLGLNNRKIGENLKTAISAIQYEYEHGIGSSRDYDFVMRAEYQKVIKNCQVKHKQAPGQLTFEDIGFVTK